VTGHGRSAESRREPPDGRSRGRSGERTGARSGGGTGGVKLSQARTPAKGGAADTDGPRNTSEGERACPVVPEPGSGAVRPARWGRRSREAGLGCSASGYHRRGERAPGPSRLSPDTGAGTAHGSQQFAHVAAESSRPAGGVSSHSSCLIRADPESADPTRAVAAAPNRSPGGPHGGRLVPPERGCCLVRDDVHLKHQIPRIVHGPGGSGGRS